MKSARSITDVCSKGGGEWLSDKRIPDHHTTRLHCRASHTAVGTVGRIGRTRTSWRS